MAGEQESYIFAEDVVCLKDSGNSSKLGLVIKSGSNVSDSEDSSDSDEEEHVKSGELLVCWYPSGQEEVISESKVVLADRSLQPGDVVRHRDPKCTNQKGYITDIQITAEICILGTQLVITDVDCKKYITPLEVLCPWTRIAFGPWVGYIKNVYHRVILWLKNGSRCCLEEDQLSMLYDIAEKRDEDSPFYNQAFFPSQSVVGPARAFKEAKWLSKIKPILNDQNQVKAVVEEAKVVKVDVEWQVCGSCPPGCKKEDCAKPPEETITEDKLDQIKIFEHYQQAGIQIGDKGYYIVKDEDVPVKDENNTADCAESKTSSDTKQNKVILDSESKKCNGSIKMGNKKQSSGHKDENSSHKKLLGTNQDIPMVKESGAVKGESCVDKTTFALNNHIGDVDHNSKDNIDKEKSVATSDQDTTGSGGHAVTSAEEGSKQCENHVSDSDDGDIESDGPEHPKQKTSKQESSSSKSNRRRRKRLRHRRKTQFTVKIRSGDRVCVEVIKTKTLADVMWQNGQHEKGVDTLNLIPAYHIDEHQFFPGYFVADKRADQPSSKYGVVQYAQHDDRTCKVKWFDKNGDDLSVEEDVSVYDIVEHPDFAFNPGDLVVGISASVRDRESAMPKEGHCVAGQVVCVNKDGHVVVAWVGGNGSQCSYKPQDLYKVESEDEDYETESYSGASHSGLNLDDTDEDEWETASEVEENNENQASNHNDNEGQEVNDELIIDLPDAEQPESPTVENVDVEALNNANNLAAQTPAEETSSVDRFFMLTEVPTSHNFKERIGEFAPNNPRKFMSVLKKEILLLQSSLPPGILIRGFEDAMGLFSVLIFGPEDTPYEDGVFLFDVALPADYPSSPPSVFFHSYSKNGVNPNLYVDGTVCISLLGTWSGKNNEIWTPKSNVLQLLLSIQGLILCKEPYYNEAGYEKHRGTLEGKENSRLYNEMAILELLTSMEKLVKTAHPVFDKEIKQHFKKNGERIIKRFQSWISQAHNTDKCQQSSEATARTDNDSAAAAMPSTSENCKIPEFPLFPLSRGFLICLERSCEKFKNVLEGIAD